MSHDSNFPKQGQRFNPFGQFCGAFIPNVICENRDLTPTAKLVYGRLAQFAGRDGRCFPKYETIGESCGLSERTAINAVAQLVKLGFLEKQKSPGRNGTNFYYFLWHPSFSEALRVRGENFAPQGESPAPQAMQNLQPRGEEFAPKENQRRESRREPPQTTEAQGTSRGGGEPSEAQEEYIRLKVDAVAREGRLRESKAALERALRGKALNGTLDMSDLDDLRYQAEAHDQARERQARDEAEKQEQERLRLERDEECRRIVKQGVEESGKSLEEWAKWFEEEGKKPFNLRKKVFGLTWIVANLYFFQILGESNKG